ncbi:hypothetical protein LCGC14_2260900, partial [marine sediment metagenome]
MNRNQEVIKSEFEIGKKGFSKGVN